MAVSGTGVSHCQMEELLATYTIESAIQQKGLRFVIG
jgi:hypothetical protein